MVNKLRSETNDQFKYTKSAVSKWENGKTRPPEDVLLELADILNVSADTFLRAAGCPTYDRRIQEKTIRPTIVDLCIDPPIIQVEKDHFAELADIVGIFLLGDLDRIPRRVSDDDANDIIKLDTREILNRKELSKRLENNMHQACVKYNSWLVQDCFAAHIEAEYLEGEKLYPFMQTKPIKLIRILMEMAKRRNFISTCSICEDR